MECEGVRLLIQLCGITFAFSHSLSTEYRFGSDCKEELKLNLLRDNESYKVYINSTIKEDLNLKITIKSELNDVLLYGHINEHKIKDIKITPDNFNKDFQQMNRKVNTLLRKVERKRGRVFLKSLHPVVLREIGFNIHDIPRTQAKVGLDDAIVCVVAGGLGFLFSGLNTVVGAVVGAVVAGGCLKWAHDEPG